MAHLYMGSDLDKSEGNKAGPGVGERNVGSMCVSVGESTFDTFAKAFLLSLRKRN